MTFDGRMIGLDGEVHDYPRWFFLKLKAIQRNFSAAGMDILARDKQTGLWRILPAIIVLRELLETVYYNPSRQVRASLMQINRGRSMVSLWSMLDGLTTPVNYQVEPIKHPDLTILVAEAQRRLNALGPEASMSRVRMS